MSGVELLHALGVGTRSVDEAEGRVYGWLLGVVTDVDVKLCRVRAQVATQGMPADIKHPAAGHSGAETTDWLLPALPGGIESIPNIGDRIIVIFHDGDPNRGAYLYFPQSTTKNRPTDAMALGTTLVGVLNYIVDQINQLRSDFVGHVHLGPSTVCANGGPWTGSTATPTGGTSAQTVNKVKAADGSVVPNNATSAVVLSGRVKVGL